MTAITATMNQWEPSQDSPEVIVNENFKTLQWSSVYGCNPDTTAGLTWGYYGGEYGGFTVTAGTLTLTTATTNYIVVLRSTGVISTSTSITNWNDTAAYARVYLVTTGASTVSAVVDHRARTNGIFYVAGTFTGGTLTSALNEAPIVTIASSTTPAIFAAAGNTISMTGTTTVTGFDTIAAGAVRRVVFTGILQLTHNATSMINLTGANITTAAGDIATFLSLGSGNTRMVGYERADGTALAGAAGSTQGKQSIYVAAGSIAPSSTGGCSTLTTIASAANQPDIVTLNFDATTQEYAQFSIAMPKKWNEGTVTFKAYWSHAATTTNFGVVWDLQAVAVSDDDAIAVAYGTAQTSTDTGGTTNDLYVSPESSAITVAGTPAAEDMVFFRLSRVTGNGSDTMAIDARLHGIMLYVTTDADTDA